jgi:hypothetical protein
MNGMAGVRVTLGRVAPVRAAPNMLFQSGRQSSRHAVRGAYPLAAWLALIGLIVPTEINVNLAGAAFTSGRIGLILLLFPAIFTFCRAGRRLLLSDLFSCATGAWMMGAAVYVSGFGALAAAPGGEALEFLASYWIARAFFFGPAALATFIRVLKFLAIFSIILALADFVSGRLIVHDTIAAIVGAKPPPPDYRLNVVRATSTFDHSILFGAFCSLVAAILLYWERAASRRALWVGLCFIGCIMSLSSAALLSFSVVLTLYTYDRSMKQYPWRWGALWIVLVAFFSVMFLAANAPLGWLISHLTFDPESGYFRIIIWNAALEYITRAPLTGYAFNLLNHDILDHSVDCVWLLSSLHYGIPMVIFLFLANVTALLPVRAFKNRVVDSHMALMCTAFTIILMMFTFLGLTVHFWNFMWIFWGLCIGIRTSLREFSMEAVKRSAVYSQPAAFPAAS